MDLSALSLPLLGIVFAGAALVIGWFGIRLTREADRLADATGMGEALMGGLLLGGITSLPGITASVTAAAAGHANLAVSNALGGIAAQTALLAIADMFYRKANLEHAASSLSNMLQAALLIVLLAMPLLAMAGRNMSVLGIHPISLLLILAYGFGMRMVSRVRSRPMWKPRLTDETRPDQAAPENVALRSTKVMWIKCILFGGIIGFSGYVVAKAAAALSAQTGLSETFVGALLTAICTSLPELVTSVAAVRKGALTMAVGGIIGGNCFDVLFLSFADFAYRDGSIYHAINPHQIFLIALSILLTGILLLGLLRREKHGIANIGFESVLILVLYLMGMGILFFAG